MRTFSTTIQNLIDDGRIDFFYLMELNFNNDYYFTTAPFSFSYNGHNWLSDGGIFSMDTPKFNNIVDREAYTVTLLDFDDVMMAEFEANVIGKPITVWLGFFDENGDPLLNSTDIIQVYKGVVDSPSISNDWETKVATIQGTSPMSDLDMVNSFISSKDGMDQVSSSDTSFDSVYIDSALNLKWGKA